MENERAAPSSNARMSSDGPQRRYLCESPAVEDVQTSLQSRPPANASESAFLTPLEFRDLKLTSDIVACYSLSPPLLVKIIEPSSQLERGLFASSS